MPIVALFHHCLCIVTYRCSFVTLLNMDPLSIMASVVGLLTATGKVSEILASIVSNLREAPRLAGSVLSEVNDFQRALASLYKFLIGVVSAPKHRAALIRPDQLIITLTEAVLTFLELEALITPLAVSTGSDFTLRSRIKWARKEETISRIVQRLQRYKSSLSLMLNIVQWYASI